MSQQYQFIERLSHRSHYDGRGGVYPGGFTVWNETSQEFLDRLSKLGEIIQVIVAEHTIQSALVRVKPNPKKDSIQEKIAALQAELKAIA